jgi:predicted nucleic acid-binding protein
MNKAVCVDASFVVALLTGEQYTTPATAHWKEWLDDDLKILAPTLFGYEVTSALYRKVLQKAIEPESGQEALRQFLAMDIESTYLPELHARATELAMQFKRPNTYDAHYLALAEYSSCPLWTADERLFNAVKGTFKWIRWIEETT